MPKIRDLTNEVFGRLTVISRADNYVSPKGKKCLQWLCRCACGNNIVVTGDNLKRGNSKSCGCFALEIQKQSPRTHGLSSDPLYRVWRGMIDRCNNENHISYKNYGAIGISVCPEWVSSFENFYDFCINTGYKSGLQIDRIKTCGDYTPKNCRFVTHVQNSYNKRSLGGSSQFKGVFKLKNKKKWRAVIKKGNEKRHLGYFTNEIEAALAYNKAAGELFGEYAYLNVVGTINE